jgi:hypothetical protein
MRTAFLSAFAVSFALATSAAAKEDASNEQIVIERSDPAGRAERDAERSRSRHVVRDAARRRDQRAEREAERRLDRQIEWIQVAIGK